MKTATRLIHLLVVSSLALLALASCDYVPLVSTVVKHNKASQDMWSVRLNVSGGFAGVRQSIEVDSEGMMVIQDERRFNNQKPPALRPADFAISTLVAKSTRGSAKK